jgi:hypothetical protein
MSLIVAELDERGVFMVADLRLVDRLNVRLSNPFTGTLKLVVAHRGMCIGYAGAHDAGTRALRELPVVPDGPFNIEQVEDHLLQEHLRCNRSIDFLVSSMAPSPSVVTIRDGTKHLPTGGRCWIGDPAGYEVFQRAYFSSNVNTNPTQSTTNVAAWMNSRRLLVEAMRVAVDDDAVPTVGDAVVAVFPDRDGFRYSCAVEAHTGREQSIPSGVWTTVEFGQGAQAGSFTQSVLAPVDAGVGAIAIYIREVQRGALYFPRITNDPIVFGAPTQVAFAEEIGRRYGVRLAAPSLS